MNNSTYEVDIFQYLRGYAYGVGLYPPDICIHDNAVELHTPFRDGYWKGEFDYYCLLTGALLDEI